MFRRRGGAGRWVVEVRVPGSHRDGARMRVRAPGHGRDDVDDTSSSSTAPPNDDKHRRHGQHSSSEEETPWCSHRGAGILAPPARSSSSVRSRCALCRRVTRIERHRSIGNTITLVPRGMPAGYTIARVKKRAILVSVSYTVTEYELRGTVKANDVDCRRSSLSPISFGFNCIIVLTMQELAISWVGINRSTDREARVCVWLASEEKSDDP